MHLKTTFALFRQRAIFYYLNLLIYCSYFVLTCRVTLNFIKLHKQRMHVHGIAYRLTTSASLTVKKKDINENKAIALFY